MIRLFGENGRELARHARGQDDRQIVTEHETKSISQETTFSRDISDDKVIAGTLHEQSVQVGRKLRESILAGTTIKLKIRWPDFTTLTRQITLTHSTDQADEIWKVAQDLMKSVRRPGQAVRLIGIGVSGLAMPIRQLSLWDTGSEKSRRLQEAIDELRDKYGEKVIYKGDSAFFSHLDK
jgi:nucleotidyltransferase/DNA polymerase involved in DNA repair